MASTRGRRPPGGSAPRPPRRPAPRQRAQRGSAASRGRPAAPRAAARAAAERERVRELARRQQQRQRAERQDIKRQELALGVGVGHPRSRARLMLGVCLFVLTLFAAQLVRVQGFEAQPLAMAAQQGRVVKAKVPAKRGAILDAYGTPLAVTVDRFDITADPTAMPEYTKRVDGKRTKVGIDGAVADIAALTGGNAADLKRRVAATSGRFMYLVKDVSPETWHAVRKLGINGIYAEPTTRREYPRGSSLAPLVGYLGHGTTPAAGMEIVADQLLRGQDGSTTYEQGAHGQRLPSGIASDVAATPGRDVQLTVDADLQFYAQNVLADQVRRSQALSATAIVLDAKTGDVKAIASYPSFDPATVATSKKAFLPHRAFVDVYEPGSTGKVVTMAALLETGTMTPETRVVVPYSIRRAGHTFHDSHQHPTQYLTLNGVLAESSNVGTILLGEHLKAAQQEEYLRKFGLGKPSGLGFPGESPGLLVPSDRWGDAQRYTVMFGQGVSSTSVQQAGVFQTVANGGVRIPPRLVLGTRSDGRLEQAAPKTGERVISAETARQLTLAMEKVVSEDGTAFKAAVPNYRVAGKTSTAERYDPELKKYNGETASFIGFAPASNPRFVVAVAVQRPTVGSVYGGDVAAPPFSRIMAYALKKYDVPPDASPDAPQARVKYDPSVTPPQVQDGGTTRAAGAGTTPPATDPRREERP